MELILVGIGGMFGSLTRFQLSKIINKYLSSKISVSTFSISTFIINVTGAFLLGVLSAMMVPKSYYLILGEGFLGAYTTFSTFMLETFALFKENHVLSCIVYIFSSILFGIIGYTLGFKI